MKLGIRSVRTAFPLRSKRTWLLCAALAGPMLLAGCSHPVYYAPPPPSAYAAVRQQGFAEGSNAAQNDIRRGMPPNMDRHRIFRRPPVAPPFINDFRRGFAQGYSAVMHTPPPPPVY